MWDCNNEAPDDPILEPYFRDEHLCPLLAEVIYGTRVEHVSLRMDTACAQALDAPSSAVASSASCCSAERCLTMEPNEPNARSLALPSNLKTLTINVFLSLVHTYTEDPAWWAISAGSCGADPNYLKNGAEHRQEMWKAARELVDRMGTGTSGQKVTARLIFNPRKPPRNLLPPDDPDAWLVVMDCVTGEESKMHAYAAWYP